MPTRFSGHAPTIVERRSQQLLDLFLAKRENAGLQPVSLDRYRFCISRFLDAPGVPSNPALWTDEHVDIWLSGLRKQGLAPATLAHNQRHLFTFLGWLYEREELPKDIRKRVQRIRVPEKRGRTASLDVVGALLLAAQQGHNPLRDAAIVWLLWSTGIRRQELVMLDLADMLLDAGELRMRAEGTKGKREARLPFCAATKAALMEYKLDERGPAPGPLFPNRGGQRFSPRGISDVLMRLAARAEVTVSPHDFRRGFASRARREGLDIGHVMRLLRHRTPAMSLRYSEEGEDDAAISAYRKMIG